MINMPRTTITDRSMNIGPDELLQVLTAKAVRLSDAPDVIKIAAWVVTDDTSRAVLRVLDDSGVVYATTSKPFIDTFTKLAAEPGQYIGKQVYVSRRMSKGGNEYLVATTVDD